MDSQLNAASKFLSPEELEQIRNALRESDDLGPIDGSPITVNTDGTRVIETIPDEKSQSTIESKIQYTGISKEEADAIERAIKEADDEEQAMSLQLALRMQEEDERWQRQRQLRPGVTSSRQSVQGNVRTMTRAELKAEAEACVDAYMNFDAQERHFHEPYQQKVGSSVFPDQHDSDIGLVAGFRMNSKSEHVWSRLDQNSILGPNHEVRTKHDGALDSQSNIHRLGLEDEGFNGITSRTFNSFQKSMKRKTKKGVQTHGTGRAGSDSDGTKGGALDAASFEHITKAINSGWINKLNGIVKEGKEAVIYHGDKGTESGDFDIAVKIFKRIQEFRNRGEYVDGDPRFDGSFNSASKRQQLDLWTEKEFRNLIRANRAGVPVPTPLMFKGNMLCMRFMGAEGWPAPQLREANFRKGSKKWEALYRQVLDAIRSLYIGAKLVHGDLSEYNIMVVPGHMVENMDESIENPLSDVQAVLIDFGQSVGCRHPSADELLIRDIDRVASFFSRNGVDTMSQTDTFNFVTEDSRPQTQTIDSEE